MAEYINRQAAIDALGEEPENWIDAEFDLGTQDQWRWDVKAIKAVPPADVRPVVRGRWEDKQFGPWGAVYATCSACRGRVTLDPAARSFCPRCGADMREP